MLPTSASLQMSDATTQTTGPLGAATAPVFSVVHQVGKGNSANPTASAAATSTPGASSPAPVTTSASSLPNWLLPVGAGLVVVAVLALLLKRKAKK